MKHLILGYKREGRSGKNGCNKYIGSEENALQFLFFADDFVGAGDQVGQKRGKMYEIGIIKGWLSFYCYIPDCFSIKCFTTIILIYLKW